MKGKMKKLFALALAAIMVLAMGITASAENDSSIVIKGALDGAKYKAYKIFDVDAAPVGEGETGYTYTRPVDAQELGNLNDLFTVVKGSEKIYYTPKDGLTGSELAEALENVAEEYALNTLEEVTGANGTATISGLDAGYYYVVSDQGTVAMLRAVSGETTITEKNTTSGWGDGGGKKAYSDEDRTTQDKFYAIGDTIYYEVTYKNAVNFVKKDDATEKVYQYTAKDTMPTGVELKVDSIEVTVTEKNGTSHNENTYKVKTDTEITTNGFEIVIPWAATESVDENDPTTAEDFIYQSVPAEIKITYQATVTKDVNSEGEALTNKARISYNANSFTPDETPDPGDNDVYTGAVIIQKYDSKAGSFANASNEQKLKGATFKIYQKDNDGRKYLIQNADTKAITWGGETEATEFTTDTDGTIKVVGLDAGTYYLKETAAPAGYNALEDTEANEEQRSFTIAEGNSTEVGALVVSREIANSTGAILPSTGGIGTTIFYVVGGILVVVAGVLLITKKRMSGRD